MNNNLYTTPNFIPSQSSSPPNPNIMGNQYSYNQSDYAETLLKNNVGKNVQAHVSFTDSIEWRDSIFTGILEEAGKDYILIYDQGTNKRYLIWSVYLDYIVFDTALIK